MHLLQLDTRDPALNLAVDEVLLDSATAGDVARVWRNAPSVIIGANQVAGEEVDAASLSAEGLRVYRRCTGGGAVFHDEGVVNFSFVTDAGRPVAELLHLVIDAIGVEGLAMERNDVLLDGRKIIGTAQAVRDNRRLFHGSILYDADLERMGRVLTPEAGKLARHGVASVAARVANLRPQFPGGGETPLFVWRLVDGLARRLGLANMYPSDGFLRQAERLRHPPVAG